MPLTVCAVREVEARHGHPRIEQALKVSHGAGRGPEGTHDVSLLGDELAAGWIHDAAEVGVQEGWDGYVHEACKDG